MKILNIILGKLKKRIVLELFKYNKKMVNKKNNINVKNIIEKKLANAISKLQL